MTYVSNFASRFSLGYDSLPMRRQVHLALVLLASCGRPADASHNPKPVDAPVAQPDATSAATDASEAFAIEDPIRSAWLSFGGAARFGKPIAAMAKGPLGSSQRFEKGCIGPDGSGVYEAFESCDPAPDLAPLLPKLAERVTKYSWGTQTAVTVEWLPTGQRFSHRGTVPQVAASAAKFFWAAAALNRVAVEKAEPFAVPAFALSDNDKGKVLVDLAGGADAVNAFTEETLGIPSTLVGTCTMRDEAHRVKTCRGDLGGNNWFATDGAVMFLEKVWRGEPLHGEKRKKLLEWAMLMPGWGFSIGHQLPQAAQDSMHHKRAELPTGCCSYPDDFNWTSELAIIRTPRGPYAIAISLSHSASYPNQLQCIEWASCVLYHALAKDAPDPFEAPGCIHP